MKKIIPITLGVVVVAIVCVLGFYFNKTKADFGKDKNSSIVDSSSIIDDSTETEESITDDSSTTDDSSKADESSKVDTPEQVEQMEEDIKEQTLYTPTIPTPEETETPTEMTEEEVLEALKDFGIQSYTQDGHLDYGDGTPGGADLTTETHLTPEEIQSGIDAAKYWS